MKKDLKWKFNTVSDKAKVTVGSSIGIATFITGVSSVFNPIIASAAFIYAGIVFVKAEILMQNSSFRKKAIKKMLKTGHVKELPENHNLMKRIKKVSKVLGNKKIPKVLLIDEDIVAKMSVPPGFRKLLKPAIRKHMHKVFGVSPNANLFITTEQALARNKDSEVLDFIVAHEMSHHKVDAYSPARLANYLLKKSTKFLFVAGAVAMGLGFAGVALPFAFASSMSVGTSMLALVGIKMGADLGVKYAQRVAERRADRNALYATRNYDGAYKTMDMLHSFKERNAPKFVQAFQTHPGYYDRVGSLQDAWSKISANDNKAKANKRTVKTRYNI